MDLHTEYLGLQLRSPLVPSASPLTESLDALKQMEDAGAGAVVLPSLFEEQLRLEHHAIELSVEQGTYSHAEALTYFPELPAYAPGPEEYLQRLAKAKQSLEIPVIASLNGVSFGSWTTFSKQMEQAGADALELNIYSIPTNPEVSAEEIEEGYLTILGAVRAQVKIPVAVKLSPYFTNLSHFAHRLDRHGVNGLVLFNRFYQPDIVLESLEVKPNLVLSTQAAMRLPLRWTAILRGRIHASLAASGGIHDGLDALKMLMAGADVAMLCSILIKRGVGHIAGIEEGMRRWMEEHEYKSVEQLKGSLSQQNCPDPSAFERAQYIRALRSFAAH